MKKISFVLLLLAFFSLVMKFGFVNEDILFAENGDPIYEVNVIDKSV